MSEQLVRIDAHDPNRYRGLADGEIASELRTIVARLLIRGRLETLLARREIGGLLTEYARLPRPSRLPNDVGELQRTVLRARSTRTNCGVGWSVKHAQLEMRVLRDEANDLRHKVRQMPNRAAVVRSAQP